MLKKIISGGQTGVDRGALDAALDAKFPCGGWCPTGRLAEDGIIPAHYPMSEMRDGGYRERTRKNVVDSDGTLVIYFGELGGGTRETVRYCETLGKPVLALDAGASTPEDVAAAAREFVRERDIAVLNVAGPRESGWLGARRYASEVLALVLVRVRSER